MWFFSKFRFVLWTFCLLIGLLFFGANHSLSWLMKSNGIPARFGLFGGHVQPKPGGDDGKKHRTGARKTPW